MKTLGKVSDFVGKYMAVITLLVAALAFDAEERVELQKGNNENIATYETRKTKRKITENGRYDY